MSRRVSLPGADELFRTTGGMGLQSSSPRRPANGSTAGGDSPRVPSPAGEADPVAEAPPAGPRGGTDAADGGADTARTAAPAEHNGRETGQEGPQGHRRQEGQAAGQDAAAAAVQAGGQGRRRGGGRGANRRPSGRERHDEKITVYVSAEELMDLEHARLVLRGEHGLAVDRGRIVREAVAVVLADLESRGDASILVRRLRGR
ncbi:hypothetical protein [Streptomyces pinistramenti]|uniref:hypothetical protein n=1 Tax=Streptomyces pinistramenti TaxID=2884812 RepID=UPI001D0736E3|nr:hypothetical protein [Streptomyces pinistramenti]MCB5909897.1 hypothetical protein [Streptomyces pinistramenti]